jgi:hypothetical protein
MIVRVRWQREEPVLAPASRVRRLALKLSYGLAPAAAVSSALAMWRLGADLKLIAGFLLEEGLFSHWQVWMALAVLLQLLASTLRRYGRGGAAMP